MLPFKVIDLNLALIEYVALVGKANLTDPLEKVATPLVIVTPVTVVAQAWYKSSNELNASLSFTLLSNEYLLSFINYSVGAKGSSTGGLASKSACLFSSSYTYTNSWKS